GDRVLRAGHPLSGQFGSHTRRTIRLATGGVHLANLVRQFRAPLSLSAGGPIAPGVIAAARHLQHLAQRVHGKLLAMIADEDEPHDGCLAKKAVAFFKISRSMSSRLFSSRSCRISARNPLSLAVLPPAAGNFFNQPRSEVGCTPRLFAASATE